MSMIPGGLAWHQPSLQAHVHTSSLSTSGSEYLEHHPVTSNDASGLIVGATSPSELSTVHVCARHRGGLCIGKRMGAMAQVQFLQLIRFRNLNARLPIPRAAK